MARGVILSDPQLEVITIDDFTLGIQQFTRGSYPPTFPLSKGSASSSFRCYAEKGVGLCPFPKYLATGILDNSTNVYTAVCAMTSLGAGVFGLGESLLISTLRYNTTGPLSTFNILQVTNPTTPLTPALIFGGSVYSSLYAGDVGMVFNNLVAWFTATAAPIYNVVGLTIDPLDVVANQLKWITVPSYNTNANSLTATIAVASGATPLTIGPVFVASSRGGVIGSVALEGNPAGVGPGFQNAVYLSDVQAPTNWSTANFYAPSNSNLIGSWGSVSTGEFVVIFQGQGMAVIYGDPLFPTSVLDLPGVIGTGQAIGPAASTSIGLIYPTDSAGVYAWNGGNTSEKISEQIPDDQFIRSQYTADLASTGAFNPCLTHHDVWNNWVMFANNWMYDCETESWWLVEDPSIANFQVHTGSHYSPRYFYSTDGFTLTPNATIHAYLWDSTLPSSSYTWTSNPIGNPGNRMNLNTVEIVASNPTPTPSTIIVTPISPPGQSLYGNQNTNQAVTFTIPPVTSGYRSSLRFGYTDYNVCVNILANNAAGNSAPILHEISFGVEYRSSATQ